MKYKNLTTTIPELEINNCDTSSVSTLQDLFKGWLSYLQTKHWPYIYK